MKNPLFSRLNFLRISGTMALASCLVAGLASAQDSELAPANYLYASTSTLQETSSVVGVNIAGLTLTLPIMGAVEKHALITLTLPYTFAHAAQSVFQPGGLFLIQVGGVTVNMAGFTADASTPSTLNTGRRTCVVTILVPLTANAQTVQAQFAGVRGATVVLDTQATSTLSALLVH